MLLGNAPSSFYKYKYPKHWAEKQGAKGAKVFIYKVQILILVKSGLNFYFQGYIQHQINQEPGVTIEVKKK